MAQNVKHFTCRTHIDKVPITMFSHLLSARLESVGPFLEV